MKITALSKTRHSGTFPANVQTKYLTINPSLLEPYSPLGIELTTLFISLATQFNDPTSQDFVESMYRNVQTLQLEKQQIFIYIKRRS